MDTRWNSFVRNIILSTGILVVLYGLRAAAPLGTLLLAFNPVRITTILGLNYPESFDAVIFIMEIFLLGLVGTTAAHLVHRWATDTHHGGWYLGVAGALSILSVHWIKWAIQFFGTTHTDTEPLVITGISGVILLVLAGWFTGMFAGSGAQK
ncbi:hypothetical protein [Halohasta litchfieldiae]|jgi:hypothetical protein|uniref:Uncharacterized protein n=1 Tax=Halohasta litchfieldiae TaxID=1073996 RepID=A0A1H6RV85_9EURY|nr:hypothetical protein [Halohasta litchfieldiae]SEI59661.1 hypothetical protein SAMN05444271_103127 [Halohasta litchfieldiae]